MDGVIVLDSCVTMGGWVVLLTFLEFGLIAFAVATAVCCYESPKFRVRGFGVLMAIAQLYVGYVFYKIMPRYTQLDVTLENGVSWSEFADRYDVLEVKGRILTIKERRPDDGPQE